MKVRSDFVSNSSSTSFIVAIDKKYNLYSFCKDIAKKSVSQNRKDRDPKLRKLNEVNLAYSLLHYELLFLGSYLCEITENVVRKDELPKTLKNGYCFNEDYWNRIVNDIEGWKRVKDHPSDPEYYFYKMYDKSWLDESVNTLHVVRKYFVGALGIAIEDNYELRHDSWFEELVEKGKADEHQLQVYEERANERLKAIKEICLKYHQDYESVDFSHSYQITMDTIKNTRAMLKAGLEMEFEDWEDIESLEARLKKGEKIFMIRANNSGDGYLRDGIYCEEGSEMMSGDNGMAMEYIHSECG